MPIIIVVLCSILAAELAASRAFPASVHTFQSDLPSGSEDLHPVQVAANRLRRKVGGYEGPGPVQYMEIIRERLESHEETDATAVWGILDRDVVQEKYRPKPNNGKCTLTQTFNFPMKTLIKEYSSRTGTNEEDNGVIPLTRATLRTYIQAIPRHLPDPGDNFTVSIEVLTAVVDRVNSSTIPDVTAAKENITVSHDMKEHQWMEISMTEGIRSLNVSKTHEECLLMVKVVFTLDVCTKKYKKVPLMVVDPATIPVEESERREKHLTVQPMVILYLDEPEVKEQMRLQTKGDHVDEFLLGEDSGEHPSKREADPTANTTTSDTTASESPCHLENLTISFHAARLHHVIVPVSYNARQCVGQCTLSTLQDRKDYINNHAQLLASAASVYPSNPQLFEKEPKLPCCVPLTYGEEWLMLYDYTLGTISAQSYPNMVATSCGCR